MKLERYSRRRRRNALEREQIAKEFEASGLSCREFADRHGYSSSSLVRWVAEAREVRNPESPVVFSEVKIAPPLSHFPGTAWAIELVGSNGVTIRFRDKLSMHELAELLRSKTC
jgi:hypothetical protein